MWNLLCHNRKGTHNIPWIFTELFEIKMVCVIAQRNLKTTKFTESRKKKKYNFFVKMHFTIVPSYLCMFSSRWPELVGSRHQVCVAECEGVKTLNCVGSGVSGPV